MKLSKFITGLVLVIVLAACGSGSNSNAPTTDYSVGGTLTGPVGVNMTSGFAQLQNDNHDKLTVSVTPVPVPFTFASKLAIGGIYNVRALVAPTNQICKVNGGFGTVSGDVSTVSVNCSCTSGAVACNNGCIKEDASNCGVCGNSCGLGGVCSAGVCSCGVGTTMCSTSCIDTSSDINNCGACGNSCGSGGICSAGACTCNAGSTMCGSSCIDTSSDINNCGTCGNSCTSGNACISGTCSPSLLAPFAGNFDGTGNTDGTGVEARFSNVKGIATDSAGNIYVADINNQTIRKITPNGLVSTFAGRAGIIGSNDGNGASARFYYPSGVATDTLDNVYVADTYNNTIRKITPLGWVSTLAGTAGVYGNVDGVGGVASFFNPQGITTDIVGNVYVSDINNTIRKITPAGLVSTLAGAASVRGNTDGVGSAASFYDPIGLTTDSSGNVYVADSGNRIIRKITPTGVVSTFAGNAFASFIYPEGVASDVQGNIYVADTGNSTIRKISSTGVVSTFAGAAGVTGVVDGNGAMARFQYPSGITTDNAGNIYVTDSHTTIRKITPAGFVTTLAGTATVVGGADGIGLASSFKNPNGVTADGAGNVFVADRNNQTIRKITPAGVVSTLAGAAGVIGSADGTGAAASFYFPEGVAADIVGNVYVADTSNNSIRKISPTGEVMTLAGRAGAYGNVDGTGAAASFFYPYSVAVDKAGHIYVANTLVSTIRKITPAGAVSTIAGSAGTLGSADGVGSDASFKSPYGIAVNTVGSVIYVADTNNHIIRKVTSNGVVTTLAGKAGVSGSDDGIGGMARFNTPYGIAIDSAGNAYVADSGNSTIRKITPTGVVSTIVGVAGVHGFVQGALPGVLNSPIGVALHGNFLYISMPNGVAKVINRP